MIKQTIPFLLIIALVMSLVPAPTVFGKENQEAEVQRVVKVAYPEQKYLTEIKENGSYYGYSYEYLKKVAEFANWKLEYITYPNMTLNEQITSGMKMVESGEADLMGVMLRNEDLEKKYLYPDKNYGVVYTTLDTLESNININETNYMRLDKLRVAVLKTATTRNGELTDFVENVKINCEYIYCDTVDEQIEALKNGSADALLKVSLTFLPGLKQIAEFAPRPFYFVSGYEKEDLMEELDEAISKINITDPYFESSLRSKYFKNTISDFSLSETEMEYVDSHQELKVLVLPQYAPFSFINSKDELCGMSVSILDDIGKKAGIRFDYHVLKENENVKEQIASGEYNLVIGPPHSNKFAECYGLVFSQPYLEESLTMFLNKASEAKEKSESTLALLRDVSEPIGYEYKEIIYYDDIQKCLEAVNEGEADYGYGNRYLIDFYTSQNNFKDLNFLFLSGYNREIGFYVPNTEKCELLSIVNKYVRSMPAKDVHGHLSQALSQKDYGGIAEFLQNNPMLMAAAAVSFLFLILLSIMLLLYSRTNKKRNEKLQLAFSAKSDFLSRMSHDMRTPMNGIIGLTGLTLELDYLPPEAVENLEKIDDSAKYLLSLINDTLDMNKIESNKIVLNKELTDLNIFFEQMISVVRVNASQKNVHLIAKNKSKKLPLVYLDKVRVQQIVFNLVSNAIKFTPENGTVIVEWCSHVLSDDNILTKLMVKDTGIGIDENFLPKIFEPFEQEYNSAISNYTGTGLGLAIVKNLVDTMGGSISVISEKNNGSEFSIELVFETGEAQSEPVTPETMSQVSLQGKHILLCEDHPLNAQIATMLLEKKGMVVDHAVNGQKAVDSFENSVPFYFDAILMDICMPLMDGLTATKIIRKNDRSDAKVIPIIAMTANAFDEDVQKSMEAGMSAHLAKPIEPIVLFQTLYDFISESEES